MCTKNDHVDDDLEVPIIDLSDPDEAKIVKEISSACAEFGFFQVRNHGLPMDLVNEYREQFQQYFYLPHDVKMKWKRNESDSRGFFDDELTKQKRDWKQCLDFGVPGSRDWKVADNDPSNECLDGLNQLPSADILPKFRLTATKYFDACVELSDRIAVLMAKGLGEDENSDLIRALRENHSSFLRTNYYPTCTEVQSDGMRPLGISPHQDAGFLTVLLQDDDCHSLQVLKNGKWITVKPEPGAFTINTGDMAQAWSNGKYKAPPHRVLSNETKERYSVPFFYNPPYDALVSPLVKEGEEALYHPVLWGYFRAVRFAGDLTDFGVEIQIDDFLLSNNSEHVQKQEKFAEESDFTKAFSVEKYRPLLAPIS